MALNLPNLDDRRYADLVEEARGLITTYDPQWTNHNPSDPGITLIEMFAYHTEMLLYRLNRITDANRRMFLKLLKGDKWRLSKNDPVTGEIIPGDDLLSGDALMDEIQKTVLEFRTVDRAVTVADFESITTSVHPGVARARCVPRKNLASTGFLDPAKQDPGHMSVIVIPRPEFDSVGIGSVEKNIITVDYTKEASTGSESGSKLILSYSTTIDPSSGKTLENGNALFISMNVNDNQRSGFGEIQFLLSETGSIYQLKFEYFNGNGWKELTSKQNDLVDNTANWTTSGTVQFLPPSDWVFETDKNGNKHFRIRISTTTNPTSVASAVRIFPKIMQPDSSMLDKISNELDKRRLLTTIVNVVGPRYLRISVRLTIMLKADALKNTVLNQVIAALWNYFNPITGGKDGNGWPFGRAVYVSEIYALIDSLAGVDYVQGSTDKDGKELDEIVIENNDTSRIQTNKKGEMEYVRLYENELIDITFPPDQLKCVSKEKGVNP